MSELVAKGKIKSAQISARVYRAETGKWTNLGVIAKSKESLIRRIKQWLQRY
jgi:hypothetical protein